MVTDPQARNYVTVAGNLEATKSMIFVNGIGYDQSFWKDVAAFFENDFRLVFFEHVGAMPTTQATFRQNQSRYLNVSGYAADLLEILATLNLPGETVLVGHSVGAMAGLLASIEKPSRVGKLILIASSPRYLDSAEYRGGFSKADINAIYESLQNDYVAWSRQLAVKAMASPERPAMANMFGETLARIPQDMMLTILCSVLQTDHRAKLAKVSVPTLIIQSRDDCFVPMDVAHYIHTHIPGSTLRVIDASGHLPHVSAPGEVIAAISAFLG